MKRILSLLIAAALMLSMVSAMGEGVVEYIAAPYAVAEDANITDTYFAPVVYRNENGPSIGVTVVGVLRIDGLYFKDMDNDRELDDFEDWRLAADERAAAMMQALSAEQKSGFAAAGIPCSPVSMTVADATDDDGVIDPKLIMTARVPGEEGAESAGMTDHDVISLNLRHAVSDGGGECEAAVMALLNNVGNQYAEYAAVVTGNPVMPWTLAAAPDADTAAPEQPDDAVMSRLSAVIAEGRADNPYADPSAAGAI